jgi:hypothetical protein
MQYANYNILQQYGINTDNIYQKNAHRPVLNGISIDNDNASYFDDGIKVFREKGIYILQVSITDVTECIPYSSNLDIKAREILIEKNSIFLFPLKVKNQCLSLKQDQVNLTLTLEVKFDSNLTILNRRIYESAFINKKNYKYSAFDKILMFKKALKDPHIERIRILAEKIFFDKFKAYKLLNADDIVKQIMIFANTQVTIYCKDRNIPIIYENYDSLCYNKYTIEQTEYSTFSSSMRKYNDIIVHRHIKDYLNSNEYIGTGLLKKVNYTYSIYLLKTIVDNLNIVNCKRNNNHLIKESVIESVYQNRQLEQKIIDDLHIEIKNDSVEPFIVFYIIFSLHSDFQLREYLLKVIRKNLVNSWIKGLFSFIKYRTTLDITMGNHTKDLNDKCRESKKSVRKNSIVILEINNETFTFTQKKKRNENLSSKAMERLCTKLYKYIHDNEINIFSELYK